MADNFRVLDVSVDELQANLNALDDTWALLTQNYYDRTGVKPCPLCEGTDPSCTGTSLVEVQRRVTVLLAKVRPMPINLPPSFDPRNFRRN